MRVHKDATVAIDYTILSASGQVLDTTIGRKPFIYVHGQNQIVAGIESALDGRVPGASLDLSIPPQEAYGERDPDALRMIPRRLFPASDPPEKGSIYRAIAGDGHMTFFSVLDVTSDTVLVDANHPLAGQTLKVHVEILSVMDATSSPELC
jgi:FKBP-type peptidyl-prolyl cis-trans isomerase SlyD